MRVQVDIVSEGDSVNDLFILVAGYVEQCNSFSVADEEDRDGM